MKNVALMTTFTIALALVSSRAMAYKPSHRIGQIILRESTSSKLSPELLEILSNATASDVDLASIRISVKIKSVERLTDAFDFYWPKRINQESVVFVDQSHVVFVGSLEEVMELTSERTLSSFHLVN